MKNTALYLIIGLVFLIVIVAIYFAYKANKDSSASSTTNNTGRIAQKNCTLLYNNWQNALKELEAAKASGLTMEEINIRTVTARNAEITYNNCVNS